STVNDRISRMRNNGTIKNLVANIDASKAGLNVLAFISVLIDWDKSNKTFSAAVKRMPEVLECHNVTGDWSYLLKVRATNNSALEELISNKIKSFPGVTRSETIFVVQTDKETSALPLSL
ncbi:MAG: Lrp/AsnC family transcriptional regulator, partial [Pseudomonadota bacterium]|nr:Lrp/AsnC family transcriptional regulator [Pseudomonadota bacterium]